MPYGKRKGRSGFTVYNLLTGKVYGRNMTKGNAQAQLRILRQSDRKRRSRRR